MNDRFVRWLEPKMVGGLNFFNTLLHATLALSLVAAGIIVVAEFIVNVIEDVQEGSLIVDFLNAVGILFLLWTLSSLISAEVDYIKGKKIPLGVFLEATMITLLRGVIIEPFRAVSNTTATGQSTFNIMHYGSLIVAILVVGIVYRLIEKRGGD